MYNVSVVIIDGKLIMRRLLVIYDDVNACMLSNIHISKTTTRNINQAYNLTVRLILHIFELDVDKNIYC